MCDNAALATRGAVTDTPANQDKIRGLTARCTEIQALMAATRGQFERCVLILEAEATRRCNLVRAQFQARSIQVRTQLVERIAPLLAGTQAPAAARDAAYEAALATVAAELRDTHAWIELARVAVTTANTYARMLETLLTTDAKEKPLALFEPVTNAWGQFRRVHQGMVEDWQAAQRTLAKADADVAALTAWQRAPPAGAAADAELIAIIQAVQEAFKLMDTNLTRGIGSCQTAATGLVINSLDDMGACVESIRDTHGRMTGDMATVDLAIFQDLRNFLEEKDTAHAALHPLAQTLYEFLEANRDERVDAWTALLGFAKYMRTVEQRARTPANIVRINTDVWTVITDFEDICFHDHARMDRRIRELEDELAALRRAPREPISMENGDIPSGVGPFQRAQEAGGGGESGDEGFHSAPESEEEEEEEAEAAGPPRRPRGPPRASGRTYQELLGYALRLRSVLRDGEDRLKEQNDHIEALRDWGLEKQRVALACYPVARKVWEYYGGIWELEADAPKPPPELAGDAPALPRWPPIAMPPPPRSLLPVGGRGGRGGRGHTTAGAGLPVGGRGGRGEEEGAGSSSAAAAAAMEAMRRIARGDAASDEAQRAMADAVAAGLRIKQQREAEEARRRHEEAMAAVRAMADTSQAAAGRAAAEARATAAGAAQAAAGRAAAEASATATARRAEAAGAGAAQAAAEKGSGAVDRAAFVAQAAAEDASRRRAAEAAAAASAAAAAQADRARVEEADRRDPPRSGGGGNPGGQSSADAGGAGAGPGGEEGDAGGESEANPPGATGWSRFNPRTWQLPHIFGDQFELPGSELPPF